MWFFLFTSLVCSETKTTLLWVAAVSLLPIFLFRSLFCSFVLYYFFYLSFLRICEYRRRPLFLIYDTSSLCMLLPMSCTSGWWSTLRTFVDSFCWTQFTLLWDTQRPLWEYESIMSLILASSPWLIICIVYKVLILARDVLPIIFRLAFFLQPLLVLIFLVGVWWMRWWGLLCFFYNKVEVLSSDPRTTSVHWNLKTMNMHIILENLWHISILLIYIRNIRE